MFGIKIFGIQKTPDAEKPLPTDIKSNTIKNRLMRQPLLGAPVLWFLPLLILQTTHANAATDKGDTAFVLICTVLVLMMTIPGLSMFYAGLVRAKNSASIFTQTIAIVCLACVTWIVLGGSRPFRNGGPLKSGDAG
ncbi:MAG: hypothetical protein AAFV69_09330 [Pseudomonadota bacterium]